MHLSCNCCSFQFSRSVMSDSLWPHGLHNTRLPCPSPTPRVCSNSCLSCQWCHPTTSSSVVPFSSCISESVLHIRWPRYWSFSFSVCPPSEYSGLISFRIDWSYLPAAQESSPPQFKSMNSSELSFLCGPTLTSIHD